MFSKALLSPKHSSPKGQFYVPPKTKDSMSAKKSISMKGKSISTSDFLDQKDNSYAKESLHLDNESLLSTQIGSASNIGIETVSSLTHLNDGVATIFNEKYCRKVLEEVSVLRRELEQKNSLIEKLMKENGTLRREMEEFLTAVDDAREHIDAELRDCNQRVQDLEGEICEVRQENKLYKEEIERLKAVQKESTKKEIAQNLEEEADGFYSQAQRTMEDFYFRLNEQIADFMHSSQRQHEDFNKNLQKRIQGPQKEVARKIEHVKTESSLPHYSSPLRSAKQNSIDTKSCVFDTSKTLKSPKSPKGLHMTPVADKTSSRKNLDSFLSHTNELMSPSSYSLCNTSPGYASISQFDKNYEEQVGSILSDYNRNMKKSETIVSPSKSGMLRTKLKSDAILQEMKKKLSGL